VCTLWNPRLYPLVISWLSGIWNSLRMVDNQISTLQEVEHMVRAKTGCHLWVRAKPGLKARCSACYRRIATVGTISTFGLKLVFDNGPEMRGKLTSTSATLGPSPEKVTFRPPLRGHFHTWASYFRRYSLCWPAHIETSPRDNFWSGVATKMEFAVNYSKRNFYLSSQQFALLFKKTEKILIRNYPLSKRMTFSIFSRIV